MEPMSSAILNYSSASSDVSNVTERNVSNSGLVEIPAYIVVTSTLLYILIFFVGIIGNGLVVIVIALSQSMKTSVNLYLMNLCVADILVIIVCMPTALADIYTKEEWLFGEAMCKLVPFLENTVANASVLTILAISIERYRVVCYPLKGINDHIVKICKIVAAIWVVSIGSSAPLLSIPILRSSRYHDGTPVTVCRNPIVQVWQKLYVIVLFAMFFVLPCIFLFALNCHMCQVFRRTQENDPCVRQASHSHERRRRKRQVIKVIGSLVLIFFVCHFPFRVTVLWFTFADKYSIRSLGLESYLIILYSARIMFYLNHSLNPVIYNFVSTKFQMALKRIFCKRTDVSTIVSTDGKSRQHTVMYMTGVRSSKARTSPPKCNQTKRTSPDHGTGGSKFATNPRQGSDERKSKYTLLNGSVDVKHAGTGIANTKVTGSVKPTSKAGIGTNTAPSADQDYDVKIRLRDNTVAIKFNLTSGTMT